MISPSRLLRLGLSAEQVAAWLGLTVEAVDAQVQAAEDRRAAKAPPGKSLMTPLLLRPEMDRWETRRAER